MPKRVTRNSINIDLTVVAVKDMTGTRRRRMDGTGYQAFVLLENKRSYKIIIG